jgi:hypothetical protein
LFSNSTVFITPAQFYSFPHVAAYPPGRFIAPCLPAKTDKLPSGSPWLHEIKHDGFRIIARKVNGRVRLYSRPDECPRRLERLGGLQVDDHFTDFEIMLMVQWVYPEIGVRIGTNKVLAPSSAVDVTGMEAGHE